MLEHQNLSLIDELEQNRDQSARGGNYLWISFWRFIIFYVSFYDRLQSEKLCYAYWMLSHLRQKIKWNQKFTPWFMWKRQCLFRRSHLYCDCDWKRNSLIRIMTSTQRTFSPCSLFVFLLPRKLLLVSFLYVRLC